MTTTKSQYEEQAESFLEHFGIKFRATLSDSKPAPWKDDGKHGHHYRVTLSKAASEETQTRRGDDGCMKVGRVTIPGKRLTFDFWGSVKDMEDGNTTVTAYDVLACISGDVHCPETFEDFCSEYGDSPDSIKALQTFRRCSSFAKRLRAFFTEEEIEALSEIQ